MTAIIKLFSMIGTLLLLGYVAYFAVANGAIVSVMIWPQTPPFEAPLWLVSLIAFSAGLLVIAVFASIRISALRLRLYRAMKKIDAHHAADAARHSDETTSLSLEDKG